MDEVSKTPYREPSSMEEFTQAFVSNCRVEGFGAETTQVMACPFCAAPNWIAARIVNIEEDMQKGGTCSECNRSARVRFFRNGGQTTFEIIQTAGIEQPDWLVPKIKRES